MSNTLGIHTTISYRRKDFIASDFDNNLPEGIPISFYDIFDDPNDLLISFNNDPFVSFLPATHRQCFVLVLSSPLRWLRVTFVLNNSITLKKLFSGQSHCQKTQH